MDVVLYTTGCPKCRQLEMRLKNKGIDFEMITDMDVMSEKGFMEAPMLEINGETFDYNSAIKRLEEIN